MPSGYLRKTEGFPIRGMNTLDNASVLREGECELLVNAFPGTPPKMRKGCVLIALGWSADYTSYLPAVKLHDGTVNRIFFWARSSVTSRFYLCAVSEETDGTELISAIAVANGGYTDTAYRPEYSLINAHDSLYCFLSAAYDTWALDSQHAVTTTYDEGNKVVESDGTTIRDMCIAQSAEVHGVAADYDASGAMTYDKWYSYAFSYVRRPDSAAFTAGTTPTGMILPAGIAADSEPQRISTFHPGSVEGISAVAKRETVQVTGGTPNNNMVWLTIDSCSHPDHHLTALAQGATHLRVFRTTGYDNETLAQGATHYWLTDLPLSVTDTMFTDLLADSTLEDIKNKLFMDLYTVCPVAKYALFHKGRMWVFGISTQAGYAFYSEIAGGDGKSDLETATLYPQKYASMFKVASYYVDCDHADGIDDTGIARINDDIFFFKESKIYALYGGDPDAATVECISDNVGCVYPKSITNCEVHGVFGNCVLFLSNKGPYVLQEGGILKPFSDFKIKELWPGQDTELYVNTTILECSAAWFENTWWVFYTNTSATNRVLGYYFDPTLATNSDAPRGPMRLEFPTIDSETFKGRNLCITGAKTASIIASNTTKIVLGKFLGLVDPDDRLLNDAGAPYYEDCDGSATDTSTNYSKYTFSLKSRRVFPGPKPENLSELFDITALCHFEADHVIPGSNLDLTDENFDITIYSDFERLTETVDFADSQEIDNVYTGSAYTGERASDTIFNVTLTASENSMVGWRAYFYVNTAPESGTWHTIVRNASSALEVSGTLPAGCDRVKISAAPRFRHSIQVIPDEGFYGTFFQYRIDKLIPNHGKFDWMPVSFQAIPLNVDPEFLAGMGTISKGWTE